MFVFQGLKRSTAEIRSGIFAFTKHIADSNAYRMITSTTLKPTRHDCLIGWSVPFIHWVKLNTDGAVKGGQFRASVGGLIRDSQGTWIQGFARNIGICSVLRAELWGIYDGLTLAWNLGYRKVQVEVDSKLCVDLLTRTDTPSNDSTPLINAIQNLIHQNWELSIKHIYREGNRGADYLANLAANLELGFHLLLRPPVGVCKILEQDLLGVSFPRSCIM
ncbi:Polynucleotidyl transferase ribonuclease H-like superfamily protein [Euphorbia peplus]|nr:Polynucleotidyl transferase ribonuclease H-like superfamily protein [Euphorbia peplus]